MILFMVTARKQNFLNKKITNTLIFTIIIFILISQNNIATISGKQLLTFENQQMVKDDLKDEMNFFCFVIIRLVQGAYCYTFPYTLANILEYTNIQDSSPRLANFIQILIEITVEIGNRNPLIFPHAITYAIGKGRIHTYGLLGHGNGGSWGYGIAEFYLIGFTGIRFHHQDGGITMIGWALWCKY